MKEKGETKPLTKKDQHQLQPEAKTEAKKLSEQQRRILELMVEDGWDYDEALEFLLSN